MRDAELSEAAGRETKGGGGSADRREAFHHFINICVLTPPKAHDLALRICPFILLSPGKRRARLTAG